jgi:hypothetical protein
MHVGIRLGFIVWLLRYGRLPAAVLHVAACGYACPKLTQSLMNNRLKF